MSQDMHCDVSLVPAKELLVSSWRLKKMLEGLAK